MLAEMAFVPDMPMMAVCKMTLTSSAESVRDGLKHLMSIAPISTMPAEAKGCVEIVLAEVLNNIVEHAYRDSAGPIEITLERAEAMLQFILVDWGAGFPDGTIPSGALPELADNAALPEGGFGWHLIRSLTTDLSYQRVDNSNRLSFSISVDQPAS